MAKTQKEISHEHYIRRKTSGLCPRCGRPLDRKGHYCSICAEKVRVYQYNTRKWCREHGICTECHVNHVVNGEKTCAECKIKKAIYRAKNPIPKEKYEKILADNRIRSKIRFDERKAKGLCVACGRNMAAPGRTRCPICLEKNARVRRKIVDKRKLWLENGLCYKCGKPVYKHFKLCKDCYDKALVALERARAVNPGNDYWTQQNKIIFLKRKDE